VSFEIEPIIELKADLGQYFVCEFDFVFDSDEFGNDFVADMGMLNERRQ